MGGGGYCVGRVVIDGGRMGWWKLLEDGAVLEDVIDANGFQILPVYTLRLPAVSHQI